MFRLISINAHNYSDGDFTDVAVVLYDEEKSDTLTFNVLEEHKGNYSEIMEVVDVIDTLMLNGTALFVNIPGFWNFWNEIWDLAR